jgi:hypothetical protein
MWGSTKTTRSLSVLETLSFLSPPSLSGRSSALHIFATTFRLTADVLAPTAWAKMCVGNALRLIDQGTLAALERSTHPHTKGLLVFLQWMRKWWNCFSSRKWIDVNDADSVIAQMKEIKTEFAALLKASRDRAAQFKAKKTSQHPQQIALGTVREIESIMDSIPKELASIFADKPTTQLEVYMIRNPLLVFFHSQTKMQGHAHSLTFTPFF